MNKFMHTCKNKCIGVFTSGGDSQGMNAAIRAVVRTGHYFGYKVYFIREGYQGMVDGDDNIVEANWASVSSIIHRGGSIIGSARCLEFLKEDGQYKVAKNLVCRGITNLIAIGGDGTLKGANVLKNEWGRHLEKLIKDNKITTEQKENNKYLKIVGLVGSIDNDFYGTDMTIGADTALHRITEALDSLYTTGDAHKRTFIVEVMGRHCGYLALNSALSSEADFLFIPEDPVEEQWPENLCTKLSQETLLGKRSHIIIVAEGAVDKNGKPITIQNVKKVIAEKLHLDCRVTVLGHIQRGGDASAFDRILGCRMGVEAVKALLEAKEDTEPCVICTDGNKVIRRPLMYCLTGIRDTLKAMAEKNWKKAVELRGKSFIRDLETYKHVSCAKPPKECLKSVDNQNDELWGSECYTLAVMHIGEPASGMNAAVRNFVRSGIYRGNSVLGINNGIEGFLTDNVRKMKWSDVTGWVNIGGTYLGTRNTLPSKNINEVASKMNKLGIQGLVIIGGFEGFQAALQMYENRQEYPAFKIPIMLIPSTINNNVPGTEITLGSDTALFEITKICDRIRQYAQGKKHKVSIVEIVGKYCGYLTTMAGLSGGADAAYIYEDKFTLNDLEQDICYVTLKMSKGVERGLILLNEKASDNYNTDFIYRLFSEKGKDVFSTRRNILDNMQLCGPPTPFDRNLGTKMAVKAIEWITTQIKSHINEDGKVCCDNPETVALLGVNEARYEVIPLENLKAQTNFERKIPKEQWWLKFRPLLHILARHHHG